MRRLFALVLVFFLWLNFAPPAVAATANLTPCGQSKPFLERAANARTDQAKARFEAYANSNVLCGNDGLPHLIVDGSLGHIGEFIIPSILFLYIAGWIGWAGRSYLIAVRNEKSPEMKEIIIDVPLALKFMLSGFTWPLAALGEFTSGKLTMPDSKIPVSPR